MILTLQTLIDKCACFSQRQLFVELFGESVDMTPELCESVALQFDWTWGARHLLAPAAAEEYLCTREAAEAEYERVTNAAIAEYDRIKYMAIGHGCALTREYQRAVDTARFTRDQVLREAWDQYKLTCARKFGELYNRDVR